MRFLLAESARPAAGAGGEAVITAPIIGAANLQHLDDALAAVNVKLSPEEITSLEEPYAPHEIVGAAWAQGAFAKRRRRCRSRSKAPPFRVGFGMFAGA